ncbi:hypothetical protein ARHIZOSPH14_24670 [Agromyces rhizosphaerae]|uniref:DUF4349 domain-containing protein n=1 Tax=Agromyces rhizosphaerae TaxID=88374 RepID=A0A9W6CXN7_9MICO|nr:DUF4349 domain-containing protein [Agromyces rhizosphaerae]GLI28225.1 hypothetical protein ARHIZOSPH14_24670 [Agromyces rhizosphaerae]
MRRIAAAAAGILLTALVLTGCSFSASDTSAVSEPGVAMPEAMDDEMAARDGDMAAGEFAEESSAGADVVEPDRAQITHGSLSITADDPIAAAQRATGIVTAAGGRVDSRNEYPEADDRAASASLVLRIPSERVDAVLTELKELGTVNTVSIGSTDVDMQVNDLDARIGALQTSVNRLTQLLAEAEDIADLITIESELTNRQAQLDSLVSQRAALGDRVAYATVYLELYAPGIVAPAEPDTFWDGVVAGWNALWGFLGGLMVALGVLAPWLLFLAIIAAVATGIVLLAVRGSRRSNRQQQAATDAPGPAPTDGGAGDGRA